MMGVEIGTLSTLPSLGCFTTNVVKECYDYVRIQNGEYFTNQDRGDSREPMNRSIHDMSESVPRALGAKRKRFGYTTENRVSGDHGGKIKRLGYLSENRVSGDHGGKIKRLGYVTDPKRVA